MALLVLPFLGFVFVAIYYLGKWILGPIDRAAQERRGPARISLSDLMCLFIAVQLPLSFVSTLQAEETETMFLAFTVLTWLVAPIIWIACALKLSRACISSGKHRLLFMGLVLPVAYYGLIPFVLMGAAALVAIILGYGLELLEYSFLIAVWICTGLALVGCGLYTNWLVPLPTRKIDPATEIVGTLLGNAHLR
jgi:hypothetical protein